MMPKLLLADDSITVQRVIALTFQGEGIEVIAVGDGDQAVAAIDRERPQIVLADLSMPGRDGYAVAEYVKRSPELARGTRVVLLTGAAEPVEEARSRALGIDGVLSKPFEPHVATALVRRLLNEAPTIPGFDTVVLEGNGAGAAAAAASVADKAAGGSLAPDAIAVDDYFRRLDEALATAGLAPEAPADLTGMAAAAAQAATDRSADPETLAMPRPTLVAEPPVESDDSPKLVDAFSALLAAEEGDGAVVAGPLEVSEPVPAPAVEWTFGGSAAAAAKADDAQGDAATVMLAAVPPPPMPAAAAAPAPPAVAAEPVEELGVAETIAFAAVKPVAPVAAPAVPAVEDPAVEVAAEAAEAVQATGGAAEPLDAPTLHLPAPSAAPAALRKDVADHGALEGIDLDVFADAVAQKILHRLTDARIDAIVSERVLEIAERLVREEIERIKADAQ